MDLRNRGEARSEARQDESGAAEMLMVKPALAYLGVSAEVRAVSDLLRRRSPEEWLACLI